MKSFRTPLVLLFTAALLAGGVYFVEFGRQSSQPKNPASVTTPSTLFGFKEADVKGLSIKTLGKALDHSVVLEKDSGWKLRSPQPAGPANEAIVAFLLNLLMSQRDRELRVPSSRLAEFGFDQPLATIEIKLENQQLHTLVLGKLNFDRTGIYAIVDPSVNPQADLSILLVPTRFESAVNRPLNEWRPKPTKPSPQPRGQ
jgi:Domain of unknown function (DUF4340)